MLRMRLRKRLLTQLRPDPTLSHERESLTGFCPAGETDVLGYGDSCVGYRRRGLGRKASRLRLRVLRESIPCNGAHVLFILRSRSRAPITVFT
jgi:hypothetical protein